MTAMLDPALSPYNLSQNFRQGRCTRRDDFTAADVFMFSKRQGRSVLSIVIRDHISLQRAEAAGEL